MKQFKPVTYIHKLNSVNEVQRRIFNKFKMNVVH